jgi:hypothetical protein
MKPVILVALLGGSLWMHPAGAQSAPPPADSAPAESKAAPPPRKPTGTSATDALTENGTGRPKKGNASRRAETDREDESPDLSSKPLAAPTPTPPPARVTPTVPAVLPGPPQKNLTGQEFGLIHVGSGAKEVLAVLGPPASRIVVPDDDGHLRETFQYWVKGSPMGTVRLDNGRVVQIETKPN